MVKFFTDILVLKRLILQKDIRVSNVICKNNSFINITKWNHLNYIK